MVSKHSSLKYLLILIGYALTCFFIISHGNPHGDTRGWIQSIGLFRESFFAGWNSHVAYPPLAQIVWYLLSKLNFIPDHILVSLPSIISLVLIYCMLEKNRVKGAAWFTLFNPYFLITGVANGYTDTTFTLLFMLAMYSLFNLKKESLFLIIATVTFFYKFQFLYFFIYLFILHFSIHHTFNIIDLMVRNFKALTVIVLIFLLMFLPMPFYSGRLSEGWGLMQTFIDMSKGFNLMVAGVPNAITIYHLLTNGFEFSAPTGWGSWVWIAETDPVEKLYFNILLLTSLAFLVLTDFSKLSKLYLMLLSLLAFAPGLYSNHIGIVFPVLLYWLVYSKQPLKKYIYFSLAFFALAYLSLFSSPMGALGLKELMNFEIALKNNTYFSFALSLIFLGYYAFSWVYLARKDRSDILDYEVKPVYNRIGLMVNNSIKDFVNVKNLFLNTLSLILESANRIVNLLPLKKHLKRIVEQGAWLGRNVWLLGLILLVFFINAFQLVLVNGIFREEWFFSIARGLKNALDEKGFLSVYLFTEPKLGFGSLFWWSYAAIMKLFGESQTLFTFMRMGGVLMLFAPLIFILLKDVQAKDHTRTWLLGLLYLILPIVWWSGEVVSTEPILIIIIGLGIFLATSGQLTKKVLAIILAGAAISIKISVLPIALLIPLMVIQSETKRPFLRNSALQSVLIYLVVFISAILLLSPGFIHSPIETYNSIIKYASNSWGLRPIFSRLYVKSYFWEMTPKAGVAFYVLNPLSFLLLSLLILRDQIHKQRWLELVGVLIVTLYTIYILGSGVFWNWYLFPVVVSIVMLLLTVKLDKMAKFLLITSLLIQIPYSMVGIWTHLHIKNERIFSNNDLEENIGCIRNHLSIDGEHGVILDRTNLGNGLPFQLDQLADLYQVPQKNIFPGWLSSQPEIVKARTGADKAVLIVSQRLSLLAKSQGMEHLFNYKFGIKDRPDAVCTGFNLYQVDLND